MQDAFIAWSANAKPITDYPRHSMRVVVPDPVPHSGQIHRFRALLNRTRQGSFFQSSLIVVERLVCQSNPRCRRVIEQNLQIFSGVARRVAIEIMERHYHRNHTIHRRQLAKGNALTHLR